METSTKHDTRFQNEIRALYQNILTRAEFPQDIMLWQIYQNYMSAGDFKEYVAKIVSELKKRFTVKQGSYESGSVVLLSIQLREKTNA